MGIRLALVLGDAHYGIAAQEGKTGATAKFIIMTPARSAAMRGRIGEIPHAFLCT
jgi:hypothetical protein